jgi:hypothetical protein
MRPVMSFITEKQVQDGHRKTKIEPVAFQLKPRLFWD